MQSGLALDIKHTYRDFYNLRFRLFISSILLKISFKLKQLIISEFKRMEIYSEKIKIEIEAIPDFPSDVATELHPILVKKIILYKNLYNKLEDSCFLEDKELHLFADNILLNMYSIESKLRFSTRDVHENQNEDERLMNAASRISINSAVRY
jgi:hypothetical protein